MTDPGLEAKAEQMLAQAAALPSLDEIRDLAGQAVRHGGTRDMSMDEIRALADDAVARAEQVTVLLRRLSVLLSDGADPGGPREP